MRHSRAIVIDPNAKQTTLITVSTAISGVMSAYLPCSRLKSMSMAPRNTIALPAAIPTGTAALFALGFGIGLLYEMLNFARLDSWYFPDDRLLGLQGKTACALGVSIAWGTVPVTVAWLARLLP